MSTSMDSYSMLLSPSLYPRRSLQEHVMHLCNAFSEVNGCAVDIYDGGMTWHLKIGRVQYAT